ncbi:MAG TPA: hypothetical protein PLX50_03970 [Candidatus Aminicenantes bacterium]|nr:hypothetical protein [Candidatus Aminicenantes bacterium]
MHVRLLKMALLVDRLGEAKQLFQNEVVPLCKTQKGYRGAYLLMDPKNGEATAMTFWESEDDMLANEKSFFFQEQVAKFLKFYANIPVRESFEVVTEDSPEKGCLPKTSSRRG